MKDFNKVKGALYGVAIGDALGAPLEFMSAEQIQKRHGKVTEMIGGGWLNVKPGEVTDDTQMTIAVAEGILDCPNDPVGTVGKRFIEWISSDPKDVGNTCSNAIHAARRRGGYEPTKAQWKQAATLTDGYMNGRTAGNGALMRTIYPALYYEPGRKQLEVTKEIAEMTHLSKESTECCLQYVKEVCLMIYGYTGEVGYINEGKRYEPTGYVIDSYAVASEAIRNTNNFEDAVTYAVNCGGDADTIGAICGGMAGAKYGYDSIPQRWIDALDSIAKETLDYLADKAMKNK